MPVKGGRRTPQERIFIDRMVRTNDKHYAAREAQFAQPVRDASRLLARPAVVEDIKRQQIARLNNEMLPAALNLLEQVILDEKETTRNRITAAKIVVDRTIGQGGEAGEDKEPHEMTPAELQARIDRLRREQAERATPIIDAVPDENASQQGSVFE